MSAVAAVRLPSREESRRTSFVGMVMALASWTMLFGSLFFAYALLRLKSGAWPPAGVEPLPRLLPLANTLVLLASSAVLHRGLGPAAEARIGALAGALKGTLALGSLFLALQLAVWVPLWRSGFTIASGVYGSIFYGLTVFHALHVLAGLVVLLALLPGARKGRYRSARQSAVRLSAMFWHFVDAVWVVMFVAVYLL
jgi:cytochrome c oxidase subunit 3